MKIGNYVTIQGIKDQREARWVVLSDLDFDTNGDVEGGFIRYVSDTKGSAGDFAYELDRDGTENLLVCGTLHEYELCVGGVLVE
ncbi:MAG: hypothetical protein FWF80_07735 [Defluviitaleaceae bacterium]|nr:hypothetical protein [Defluviitaleaceae bacterium]